MTEDEAWKQYSNIIRAMVTIENLDVDDSIWVLTEKAFRLGWYAKGKTLGW